MALSSFLQPLRTALWATALALLIGPAAHAVSMDWVTVGDPGNAPDPDVSGTAPLATNPDPSHGDVGTTYRIGETEVTNAQYAEFLNAVAAEDANGLYHPTMGNSSFTAFGGIARNGSAGSYSYSPISGRESKPVNWVGYWDAVRFANWMHNGQPTGPQNDSTTEDGAYTLTASGIVDNTVTRNAGAEVFLPSRDEWYKAAYYDPASGSYFDFPTGTDAATACAAPGATPNTANCDLVADDVTDVASYTGSASPVGTFDQGGNVGEWTEKIYFSSPDEHGRGLQGGNFVDGPGDLEAVTPHGPATSTSYERFDTGFRVAAVVPEPSTALLLGTGLVGLAARRRALG